MQWLEALPGCPAMGVKIEKKEEKTGKIHMKIRTIR